MPFSIRNLFALLVFAFIAMASWGLCAAGQQGGGRDDRLGHLEMNQAVKRVDHSNPLRPTPLPDLRFIQIEPSVEQSAPTHFERSPNPLTPSLSPRLAERPAGDLDRSFFEQDQPPVVVVWLNSDLHNSLVSEKQLKQWMRSVPSRGEHRPAARINSWPSDSQSQVRTASFTSAVVGEPTWSEQQIDDYKMRLGEIKARLEAKKKQRAADESGEADGSKDEFNTLSSLADEWTSKAASDLEKFDIDTEKKKAFEGKQGELEKQKKDLVVQKGKVAALEKEKRQAAEAEKKAAELKQPIKPEPFPVDLREAIDKVQKKLKEGQVSLQADIEIHNEVRDEITDQDRRATALPELLRKNAKEKAETKKQVEELKGKAEEDLRGSLQKLQFDAKLLSLEITEELLKLEDIRHEQLGQLLPLRLEELTLKIKLTEHDLAIWSERSDRYRDHEIKERLIAANKTLKNRLILSTPKLKELAEYNKNLAFQQTSLAEKSDELEKELINVRQLQQELDESHERIKEQIETLGPTASGIRLVEHRRSLISTGKSQNRLLELAESLQFKQTRKLLLKERLEQLVLGDSFKLEALAAVEQQVTVDVAKQFQESEREMAVDVADHLLETQKKYATDLKKVFDKNIDLLSLLESAHKDLIEKVQEVKAFSDKNALWVRSSKPIELSDLKRAQAGLQTLLASDQWPSMVEQAAANFNKHQYHAGLLALVIGSLLVVRRRLRWSHE